MKSYHAKSLGDLIRKSRVAQNLGLRDLAKKIQKSPSYLSDIEYDRRVPAETVLRDIAHLLQLDFDEMMALAGRFGKNTERQLRKSPALGALFRRLSERDLDNEEIVSLTAAVEKHLKTK